MIDFVLAMVVVSIGYGLDAYTTIYFGTMGMVELNPLGVSRTFVFKTILTVILSGLAAVTPVGFLLVGFLSGCWFVAGIHNILEYFRMKQEQLLKPIINLIGTLEDPEGGRLD
jgi:hypothetical protein